MDENNKIQISADPFTNDLKEADKVGKEASTSSGPTEASFKAPPHPSMDVPYRKDPSQPREPVNSQEKKPLSEIGDRLESKGILLFLCKWLWAFVLAQMLCCCGYASLGSAINLVIALLAFYHYRKGNEEKAKKFIILSIILFFVIPLVFSLLGGWEAILPFFFNVASTK